MRYFYTLQTRKNLVNVFFSLTKNQKKKKDKNLFSVSLFFHKNPKSTIYYFLFLLQKTKTKLK